MLAHNDIEREDKRTVSPEEPYLSLIVILSPQKPKSTSKMLYGSWGQHHSPCLPSRILANANAALSNTEPAPPPQRSPLPLTRSRSHARAHTHKWAFIQWLTTIPCATQRQGGVTNHALSPSVLFPLPHCLMPPDVQVCVQAVQKVVMTTHPPVKLCCYNLDRPVHAGSPLGTYKKRLK